MVSKHVVALNYLMGHQATCSSMTRVSQGLMVGFDDSKIG